MYTVIKTIITTMKLLAILLAVVVLAQAAEIPKVKDSIKLKHNKHPQQPSHTATFKRSGVYDLRDVCGKPGPAFSIVGGTEVTPHQYPWQVALSTNNRAYFCGGSLISNDYVLTSAHCAENAGTIVVTLGAHKILEASEPGRMKLNSTEFIVHPQWDTFTSANDLALIKLPKSVTFNSYISPICLESSITDHVGEGLTVTGWGVTSSSASSISPVLRHVNATCISKEECQNTFPVTDQQICLSMKGGVGSCYGDSGGPLSSINKGVYYQVGIVSFGSAFSGCEAGVPDVYTRVSSYIDWITSETGLMIL